jgi:hypothetical protein
LSISISNLPQFVIQVFEILKFKLFSLRMAQLLLIAASAKKRRQFGHPTKAATLWGGANDKGDQI